MWYSIGAGTFLAAIVVYIVSSQLRTTGSSNKARKLAGEFNGNRKRATTENYADVTSHRLPELFQCITMLGSIFGVCVLWSDASILRKPNLGTQDIL